jgi:hypothetical protein
MMNPITYMGEVAHAYDLAPTFHPNAIRAWRALADETMTQYHAVRGCIGVVFTDMPEPYLDARAMLADIAQGRLFVSDVNHNHPVWSPEVNRAFRVVHDVVGHGTTGAGFDWLGELRAWAKHEATVRDPFARAALFTEAVGQVAWALHPQYGAGTFGVQKVATLPQWLQWVNLETEVAQCAA